MTSKNNKSNTCQIERKKIQRLAGFKAAATRARNKVAQLIKEKQREAGRKAAETRRKNKALRESSCGR